VLCWVRLGLRGVAAAGVGVRVWGCEVKLWRGREALFSAGLEAWLRLGPLVLGTGLCRMRSQSFAVVVILAARSLARMLLRRHLRNSTPLGHAAGRCWTLRWRTANRPRGTPLRRSGLVSG
jgi:hypothetical protein